jgi:Fic family protein
MRKPEKPPITGYLDREYGNIWVDLLNSGRYQQLQEKDDVSYPYWDKWKWIAGEWDIDPKKLWYIVKMNRNRNTYIPFNSLENTHFSFSTPSVLLKYLHELDLDLGGSLQSQSIVPSEDKDRYLVSSLMEEAIASSQLEGAATTRKVAKEMLEKNKKPRSHSEQMIANNYEAMKWIVANRDKKFSRKSILHIHNLITRNTLGSDEEEGVFRSDNHVNVVDAQTGSILYSPPSHDLIEKLIDDFCVFANDEDKGVYFIHPICKAIVIHFLMAYIHPFSDGNGRTARTLFYWYLVKKNYWLIEYMSVSRIILASKAQYARAYLHTELDGNDLTYFLLYNVKAIARALEDLKKYIERKNLERRNTLSMLRHTPFNERQILLINELLNDRRGTFTVQQVETKMKVSNQTARNDLNGLVNAGIMEYKKAGKQVLFFAAEGIEKKLKKDAAR